MGGAEVEKKGSNECMEGYDLDSNPSSVFSRKSGTQRSGTSGDSLFSIHMGSCSFSNDYAIINDNKSDDLPRLEEWHAPAHDHELTVSLAPVMEQEEGSPDSGESSSPPPDKQPINQTPSTPSVGPTLNSHISDASNTSFAFPVLVSASGKGESARMTGKGEAQDEAQPKPHKPPNKWFSCCSCAWPRY